MKSVFLEQFRGTCHLPTYALKVICYVLYGEYYHVHYEMAQKAMS